MVSRKLYCEYVKALERELVPAMGCTEPVSIAYAAALARATLGEAPVAIDVAVSGNILKNVKSVTVPNTGGLRGIPAAAAAGAVAGEHELLLETLSRITDKELIEIREFLESAPITVRRAEGCRVFDLTVTVKSGGHSASVRIADSHINVVLISKDGETVFEKPLCETDECGDADFTVESIVKFADEVDIADVKAVLDRQIEMNMAIAREGLSRPYGANIGKVILSTGTGVENKAKAHAAAASDARMSGCELPVVINSGSGNQGAAASIPVIVYANETGAPKERLYRALCVSNLVTIHLKTGIGKLSAYCGAVSAGSGAGAGIAYLASGDYATVAHTIVNALAITSGIICDGAKASCAAKVAFAVDAGFLGYNMYLSGNEFVSGDGIVKKGVENTIASVSRLARDGMLETDREIICIMLNEK